MSFYVGQTKKHCYRVVYRRLSPKKEYLAQIGKLFLMSWTLPNDETLIWPEPIQKMYHDYYLRGLDPTDLNYKEAFMTFHTALVVDETYLFEYEDGNEYYFRPKDWLEERTKFEWNDIEITDPKFKLLIKGETDESPEKLDRSIKIFNSWTEKGHYSVLSHNCQMFTQLCVSILLNPIIIG